MDGISNIKVTHFQIFQSLFVLGFENFPISILHFQLQYLVDVYPAKKWTLSTLKPFSVRQDVDDWGIDTNIHQVGMMN